MTFEHDIPNFSPVLNYFLLSNVGLLSAMRVWLIILFLKPSHKSQNLLNILNRFKVIFFGFFFRSDFFSPNSKNKFLRGFFFREMKSD